MKKVIVDTIKIELKTQKELLRQKIQHLKSGRHPDRYIVGYKDTLITVKGERSYKLTPRLVPHEYSYSDAVFLATFVRNSEGKKPKVYTLVEWYEMLYNLTLFKIERNEQKSQELFYTHN